MRYKKLKISALILIISILYSHSSFAQIFDSEQNPLSVKWRQLNIEGFRLIYPIELEQEAQRLANTVKKIYPSIGNSLNKQKTSIPIVLQNRGTTANGFVQLAPKKSQFYTTPPQQFDSQDWLNNLAVHELRHVAQFDKITGREKFFLTEEIYFAYLGVSVPTWAFEGDAVSTETSLTHAGRGRQPSWIMPFRTLVLSGKKMTYSKAYFGSNKDLTPGYYQLGYALISNLRTNYGKGIMDSLFSDINQRPLRPYPFANSLKKFTGNNTRQYYLKTLVKLKSDWAAQNALTKSEHYESLNADAKYVSNYLLPTAVGNGIILTLKQTKGETPGFVLVKGDQSETELFKIGYQENAWFSYGGGKLVWDEIRYDPRYKQRSYSVICSYDFATKVKKQVTFKTRLFSPAISGDGKKLIAVQIDLSNNCSLVDVSLSTGKIVSNLTSPSHLIVQTPALNETGDQMTYITVSEQGKALWLVKSNGEKEKLIPETNQQLSRPIFINDKIAFNAHYSGVDNIYEVSPASKKIMALTASKFGAFNASLIPDKNEILFNDFNTMGYQIAKTSITQKEVQPNHLVNLGAAAASQENTGNVFSNIPDSTFEAKKYSPYTNLFNFHSVSLSTDEDDQVGIQLKSNDLLNLLDAYVGLGYDSDLRKLTYNAGIIFKGLYPILSATFKSRARTGAYQYANNVYQADWRENHFNLKATVPLSFNAYHHNYSVLGEVGTSYTQRNFAPMEKTLFKHSLKFPMSYKIGFAHSLRTAERDVAPKWAQSFNVSYFNQPFDKSLSGDLLAFESSFYFPGLAKNHAMIASFNYQQTSGIFNFNNEISTVWGYSQIAAKSQLRNTLLLNYRFPILFPDAEIASLAYIRNLRGGIFTHYENIGKETNLNEPKTFGLELRSSMNLLRYQPIVDLGARLIFVNKVYNQNPILEFTFNYSF